MDNKNLVNQTNRGVIQVNNNPSAVRAKSFDIKANQNNFAQYVRTVKAYSEAGMPFNHIANAGDLLGDEVKREEIDSLLQDTEQTKAGEIAEDESRILAWQTRGEKISIIPQLSSPGQENGQELVAASQSLTTAGESKEQTIDVLEGINVSKSNQQLENNPYLQAPPQIIKKNW